MVLSSVHLLHNEFQLTPNGLLPSWYCELADVRCQPHRLFADIRTVGHQRDFRGEPGFVDIRARRHSDALVQLPHTRGTRPCVSNDGQYALRFVQAASRLALVSPSRRRISSEIPAQVRLSAQCFQPVLVFRRFLDQYDVGMRIRWDSARSSSTPTSCGLAAQVGAHQTDVRPGRFGIRRDSAVIMNTFT